MLYSAPQGGSSGQSAAFSKWVEGALGSQQPSVRNGNLPWWIIREGSWSSLRCYIVPLREGALGSQQPSVSGCWGGGGSGQPAAFSKEW